MGTIPAAKKQLCYSQEKMPQKSSTCFMTEKLSKNTALARVPLLPKENCKNERCKFLWVFAGMCKTMICIYSGPTPCLRILYSLALLLVPLNVVTSKTCK